MVLKVLKGLYNNITSQTGILRKGLPDAARWSQKNLDQFATSVRSYSTKLNSELLNEEGLYKRAQRQLTDYFEAGKEQLTKVKIILKTLCWY